MRKYLYGIVAIIAILAIAFFGLRRFGPSRARAANTTLQTADVTRGSLVSTVSGAGNLTPDTQLNLNFQQAGTIKEVKVQVGDKVKAGDVLATLDTAELQLAVDQAKANLASAQAKLDQTKNGTPQDVQAAQAQLEAARANYNKVATGPSSSDLAAAQAAVNSAQAAYDAAVNSAGSTGPQLDAAKAAVDSAQAAYDAAVNSAGATNSQLEAAKTAMEKAASVVQQAQAAYDKVAWRPDISGRPESVTLHNATLDYEQAKANYEALQKTSQTDAQSKIQSAANQLQQAKTNYENLQRTSSTDAQSKIQSARTQLEQARANLAKLQNSVTQNDLTAAQASVTQATENLDKLTNPAKETLTIAQATVDVSQATLKQAQLNLQKAQIVAPFSGTVSAVNITPGQVVSTGGSATNPAIQLSDLDHLDIVVQMAEIDVTKLKTGQTAEITLDAVPNTTLRGTISKVSPVGVSTQGVINFPVTVAITNTNPAVKAGMTANVNIVTDRRDNVLMVPNRAVRTVGRQRVVSVLFEGHEYPVQVETGVSNDQFTEITSSTPELKEGDAVVINSTTATQPRVNVGGGGFGGFGGGPTIIGGPGR